MASEQKDAQTEKGNVKAQITESAHRFMEAQINSKHTAVILTPEEIEKMVKKAFEISAAFHAYAAKHK